MKNMRIYSNVVSYRVIPGSCACCNCSHLTSYVPGHRSGYRRSTNYSAYHKSSYIPCDHLHYESPNKVNRTINPHNDHSFVSPDLYHSKSPVRTSGMHSCISPSGNYERRTHYTNYENPNDISSPLINAFRPIFSESGYSNRAGLYERSPVLKTNLSLYVPRERFPE